MESEVAPSFALEQAAISCDTTTLLSFSKKELEAACVFYGLAYSGPKAVLADRLLSFFRCDNDTSRRETLPRASQVFIAAPPPHRRSSPGRSVSASASVAVAPAVSTVDFSDECQAAKEIIQLLNHIREKNLDPDLRGDLAELDMQLRTRIECFGRNLLYTVPL